MTILMLLDKIFYINHSGFKPECANTCQEISVMSLVADVEKNGLIFQLYTAI